MKLARLLACALLALFAVDADAQYTRNAIPEGNVTGLELRIEGEVQALPGQRMRYLLTAFEVLGHRELRRASGVRVRVVSSHRLDAPLAEVTTDEHGRARVEIVAPEHYAGEMRLVFIAQAARLRIQRRFMVDVWGRSAVRFELSADTEVVEPGDTVHVLGRILEDRSGAPSSDVPVRLILRNSRNQPIGAPIVLATDALGVFHGALTIPAGDDTRWRVVALVPGNVAEAGALTLRRRLRASGGLRISARVLASVVAPGAPIPVEIIARQRDGRPVAGAVVLGLRTAEEAAHPDEEQPPPRTDASGRARIAWLPQSPAGAGAVRPVEARVRVTAAGIGEASSTVNAHIARRRWVAMVAVEGGALALGLESRLYVRVTAVDGTPAPAGIPIVLRAAALGLLRAVTDADGVAVLHAELEGTGDRDRCGGAMGLEASLSVAEGEPALRCLPVDPDVVVRVRPERLEVVAGEALRVQLTRASAVRRAAVVLALMLDEGGRSVPLAEIVVEGDDDEAEFVVPADVAGELQLRARPLVGRDRQEVRGGVARVRALRGERLRLELERTADGIVARATGGRGAASVWAVALEESEAVALTSRLRSDARHDASDAFVAGGLAARTRPDATAPAALRHGVVSPLPAPPNPSELGVLRDPERARDRFVDGRLALLYAAVEARVAAAIPSALGAVALRRGSRYRFNRGLLDALEVGNSIAGQGARGLDGLPLSIVDLERMDPAFRYDQVARRITRERLLNVLVALRDFVREAELDLAWSWRGDPDDWLPALVGQGQGSLRSESLLYDGWGRRFAIRPARGGRARFRFLESLPGYELVSAGPDGRFGNGDDVHDAFARVLPAGSLYGRAVGEELLLARLGGVELGRISAEHLQALFDEPDHGEANAATLARLDWADAPTPAPEMPVDAPWLTSPSYGGQLTAFVDSVARVALPLPATSTGYRAVLVAVDASGARAVDSIALAPASPVALVAELPTRLETGRWLRAPLSISALAPALRSVRIELRSEGAVEASFEDGERRRAIALDAARVEPLELRLRGTGPGRGVVHITVVDDAGRTLLSHEHRTRTDGSSILRSRLTGVAVGRGSTDLALNVPGDAATASVRLVVIGPGGLALDPELSPLRRSDPALIAWSQALAGKSVEPELASAVASRSAGTLDASVSAACALVALSALAADDADARTALGVELRHFAQGRTFEPAWVPALLVALAPASGGSALYGGGPAQRTTVRLRDGLRGYLLDKRDEPTQLARAAAALLLTNRDDAVGQALLEAARSTLVAGPRGGLVFDAAGPADVLDALAGTAALAIAAQQLGNEELATALLRGLAPRAWVGLRAGGEAAFWLMAATSYGTLGLHEETPTITLRQGARSRALSLETGAAVVSLGRLEPGQRTRITLEHEGPGFFLARLEARYSRPERERHDGPLGLVLRGDAGRRGGTAAFELRVDNGGTERLASPIVDIALPPNATLPDDARSAIAENVAVERVDPPDSRGLVRLHLAPLAPAARVTIALPMRWLASGRARGLAIGAYPEGRPWAITSLASRELHIPR